MSHTVDIKDFIQRSLSYYKVNDTGGVQLQSNSLIFVVTYILVINFINILLNKNCPLLLFFFSCSLAQNPPTWLLLWTDSMPKLWITHYFERKLEWNPESKRNFFFRSSFLAAAFCPCWTFSVCADICRPLPLFTELWWHWQKGCNPPLISRVITLPWNLLLFYESVLCKDPSDAVVNFP